MATTGINTRDVPLVWHVSICNALAVPSHGWVKKSSTLKNQTDKQTDKKKRQKFNAVLGYVTVHKSYLEWVAKYAGKTNSHLRRQVLSLSSLAKVYTVGR